MAACLVAILYFTKSLSLSENDPPVCHLILSCLCSRSAFSVSGYCFLMTETSFRSSGWHPRSRSAFLNHSCAILTPDRGARQKVWVVHHYLATIITRTVLYLFQISFLQHLRRFNQQIVYLHQKKRNRRS